MYAVSTCTAVVFQCALCPRIQRIHSATYMDGIAVQHFAKLSWLGELSDSDKHAGNTLNFTTIFFQPSSDMGCGFIEFGLC
jgi:hypothetical protein